MFARNFFPDRFYAPRYWTKEGAVDEVILLSASAVAGILFAASAVGASELSTESRVKAEISGRTDAE